MYFHICLWCEVGFSDAQLLPFRNECPLCGPRLQNVLGNHWETTKFSRRLAQLLVAAT